MWNLRKLQVVPVGSSPRHRRDLSGATETPKSAMMDHLIYFDAFSPDPISVWTPT
jgi:hypothetical protein